jgi:hypothetical protein
MMNCGSLLLLALLGPLLPACAATRGCQSISCAYRTWWMIPGTPEFVPQLVYSPSLDLITWRGLEPHLVSAIMACAGNGRGAITVFWRSSGKTVSHTRILHDPCKSVILES